MRLPGAERATLLLLILSLPIFAPCCRRAGGPAGSPELLPAGEPAVYSATIEQTVEDGEGRHITVTRVARSAGMLRQEWSEAGETLALITRDDVGKSFLLDLEKRLYVEEGPTPAGVAAPAAPDAEGDKKSPAREDEIASSPGRSTTQTADAGFAEDLFAEAPQQVEERVLADEQIGDYLCAVVERRAGYADGRTETLKVYRARSLGGLTVKTEAETISTAHRVRITTLRRDIKMEAAAEEFIVPAGFKRVKSLSRSGENR